ncbi:MAG: hypothetical protein ABL908_17810 [Hyphomicrobium sp.]
MPRKLTVPIGVLLTVLGAGAAGALWLDARIETAAPKRPGVRHGLMHLTCPPGSHGVPRYAKFGQSLGHGRGDVRRDGGAAIPLQDRSLTATVPIRAPNSTLSNR